MVGYAVKAYVIPLGTCLLIQISGKVHCAMLNGGGMTLVVYQYTIDANEYKDNR